ncbi:MAG: asparaginase [Candidatus Eisenbacteria bacterium]|nr:asparaginase [Candidatus Eisenbacteria bacterium]
MRIQLDVVVWRGAIAESRHRIEAAVADPDGRLPAATAVPGLVTTFRSAAKPFQLLPLVERGHADRWGFGEEELAVMAASHTGSAYHLGLVTGILGRIGLAERDLACGYHDPADPAALDHLRVHPESRSALYNNCSGKHAGMLALALAEGWPTAGYQHADHPVQQLMRQSVAESCGLAPGDLLVAVDGCSVSVFALPLYAMARGYARLAAAADDGDARERALARIRRAMLRHPRAVSGPGRLSSELTEKSGGRVLAKGGAEGLKCLALPERRLGVALKCEDGQARALGPAVVALLERLGALDAERLSALAEWREPVMKNAAGIEVGTLRAEIRSLAPAGA